MGNKKIINLTEILKNNIDNPNNRDLQTLIERYASPHDILAAMKDACQQVLELAAENARCHVQNGVDVSHIINKQSILEIINQVKE